MLYLLCNPSVMEQLNRSFMRLLRPTHLRGGGWTDKYTTELIHPETGYGALAMPEGQPVPVHVESDGAELQELLDVFVSDNALTEEEAESIRINIQEAAGEMISIMEFIPDSWAAYVLTREQMEEQGWFVQEEEV